MFCSVVSKVKVKIRHFEKKYVWELRKKKDSRPFNVNQAIMSTTPTTSKLVELDLLSLLSYFSCALGFGVSLMNLASARKLDSISKMQNQFVLICTMNIYIKFYAVFPPKEIYENCKSQAATRFFFFPAEDNGAQGSNDMQADLNIKYMLALFT